MIRLATMTSVCPDWTLDEIIAVMKRYGYHGLEPRTGWGHRAGLELDMAAEDRRSARDRLEKENLSFCCIATGARFATVEPAKLEEYLEETRQAITLASDLGAPYVRTFGGERGEGELNGIVERTVDAYRRVTDFAAEKGVTVLMETHDFWCVSAQVREVVQRVDHPNMGVLWDLMHPQRFFERSEETMGTIGPLTRHLHAHDGVYTSDGKLDSRIPLGEGIFDHATPLRLLKDSGFDGWVSVEVIHQPGSEHDADSVLRQYAEGLGKMV